jgi:hypothetical protein
MLKLNADFVVLSACNTAAGDKPGAEALSGLARAFFYAGAKSLVVSHWEVDSEATVALMSGLFAALKANPGLSHAEALRISMLQMIGNSSKPEWAEPSEWAPFVIVGEPDRTAASSSPKESRLEEAEARRGWAATMKELRVEEAELRPGWAATIRFLDLPSADQLPDPTTDPNIWAKVAIPSIPAQTPAKRP